MTEMEQLAQGTQLFDVLSEVARLMRTGYQQGCKFNYELSSLSPRTKDGEPVLPGDQCADPDPYRSGGYTIRIAIGPPQE